MLSDSSERRCAGSTVIAGSPDGGMWCRAWKVHIRAATAAQQKYGMAGQRSGSGSGPRHILVSSGALPPLVRFAAHAPWQGLGEVWRQSRWPAEPPGAPLRLATLRRSAVWPDDASGRNSGQVAGTPGFGGESVPVLATRPALDLPPVFASATRGCLPRLVVRHRAFYAEDAERVVGDHQVEWFGWRDVGHDPSWHVEEQNGNSLLQRHSIAPRSGLP